MYQESVDRMKGTAKSDTLLFILLVLFFIFAGTAATVLRKTLESDIPLYALAVLLGGMIYLIYRLRIVGYRYTVFYKEPETEYDARFDDYITHEDYPYPVGTLVFERTVSAKGTILEVVKHDEILRLLDAGAEYDSDEEFVYAPCKKEKASSIVIHRDNRTVRIYFTPSPELKKHIESIIDD